MRHLMNTFDVWLIWGLTVPTLNYIYFPDKKPERFFAPLNTQGGGVIFTNQNNISHILHYLLRHIFEKYMYRVNLKNETSETNVRNVRTLGK